MTGSNRCRRDQKRFYSFSGVRFLISVLLSVAMVPALSGCFFFTVPPRSLTMQRAFANFEWIEVTEERQALGIANPLAKLGSLEQLETAVAPTFKVKVRGGFDEAGVEPIARFLHLSDAQIRDERSLEDDTQLARLNLADYFVPPSIRRPYVEAFDSLTLAAFLVAHAKEAEAGRYPGPAPFVVHTGDLLDVSLAAELMEAMNVLSAFAQKYPDRRFYSVAGNHDGLTFGNIRDYRSDTRSMGINRSEFVAGHLIADPANVVGSSEPRGFGFGRNEIVRSFASNECEHWEPEYWPEADRRRYDRISEWCKALKRAMDGRHIVGARAADRVPLAYRRQVKVTAFADNADERLGYYSWSEATTGPVEGIRYIVLDTRSRDWAYGAIDLVQLAWLYGELAEALGKRQAVVLFSHYAPDGIPFRSLRTRLILGRMLDCFPNVLGFFYGHGHDNRHARRRSCRGEGYALVQTGSLADWPQVGRQVFIYPEHGDGSSRDVSLQVAWQFVRPEACTACTESKKCHVKCDAETAQLLETVLKASNKDSEKEKTNPGWRRIAHVMSFGLWPKFGDLGADWKNLHLKAHEISVKLRFDVDAPSAQTIFGKKTLVKANKLRRELLLEPVE